MGTQSENSTFVGGQAIGKLVAATLLKCDLTKIRVGEQLSSTAVVDCLRLDMLVSAAALKVDQQIVTRVASKAVVEDAPKKTATIKPDVTRPCAPASSAPPTVLGSQSFAAAGRDLVSIMTLPSGQAQPQERLFAGDALVGILPHLPSSELANLAKTTARLDLVSSRLCTFLVTHHDTDVSCRMLKDAPNITDVDLLKLIPTATEQQLRLTARRRQLGVIVSDAIVETGNTAAILDLLRNSESLLSHGSFLKLMAIVNGNADLESAFCNRADLPQAIGLQMFWQVNRNLRRYLLSRFLTESATLDRVMEVGMAAGAIPPFSGHASSADIELLVSQIETADPNAAAVLARCCRIAPETAAKIVNDPGGEPLTVVFKSLAQSRLTMAEALKRWLASSKCAISGENRLIELHAQFDGLSFNKTRMLLAYWDWSSREAGPFTALSI